jgi:hypothetical protein
VADLQARYTLIKSILEGNVPKYGAEPAGWQDETYAVNAANLMNTVEDITSVKKETVSIEDLSSAFDAAEEASLDPAVPAEAQQLRSINRVFLIASANGRIDLRTGSQGRQLLEAALQPPASFTNTLANLGTILDQTITDAAANNLGTVKPGDIQNAWRIG